ncbi:MAG TPA: glycosyltransferase [Candidatus Binatia bacterium]|nr:glycosyltransferase [Candidatus Binatia bacterium]
MARLGRVPFTVYLILLATLVVLIGKAVYHPTTANFFLFAYGITVTSIVLVLFFIAFHRYRDPAVLGRQLPSSRKKRYLVSCMVAAHNEEAIIAQCVQSLIDQTYGRREIIIVNDASTDGTKAVLDSFKGVKVIHLEKNVGKKKALAQAMLHAKGDLFVFTDSDSVLADDAVQRVVDAFNLDPLIGAVAGHCRALNGNKNLLTRIQDAWYEGQFSVRKAFESVFGCVTCVSGPLAAFRREAIYNFIPAWEQDTFFGKEFKFATDRTLTGFVLGSRSVGEKLKRKHANSPFLKVDYPLREWRIVYSKSARSWTKVPETVKGFLRQQVRWKKSFIRNLFFTGKFYWKKPFLPALFYYLHILFVFSGPLIAFRYLVYFPAQGNVMSAILYLCGIIFVGFMFGLAYRIESRDHKWVYRPLMSLTSTLILTWLTFYALATIRRSTWHRG